MLPGNCPALSNEVLISRAGPSVNMKLIGEQSQLLFDCDFLMSLPVSGWPLPANEWRTRERIWPEQPTVNWLTKLPCHLIGKPRNEHDFVGWRYSFSRQELELTNLISLDARLCYVALKFIFKKHLSPLESGLKSYHMLTLFFWFIEQKCVAFRNDENSDFNENLRMLLKFVLHHLEIKRVPHYFISSINLLNQEKNKSSFENVSVTLRKIISCEDILTHYAVDRRAFEHMVLNDDIHQKIKRGKEGIEAESINL